VLLPSNPLPLAAIACALTGWVGAVYGINFPIFARAAFGVRGTYVAVVCRAAAAIIWFGTQSYQGASPIVLDAHLSSSKAQVVNASK